MSDSHDSSNQAFPFLSGSEGETGHDAQDGERFDDPLADAGGMPRKRRFNEGAMLLGAVLVVAAGVLLVMRQTGSAELTGGVSSVEIQVEKALAQMTGDPTGTSGQLALPSTEQVVAMFADDPSTKQVGLSELKFNPFALRVTTRVKQTSDEPDDPGMSVADRRAQQAAQRRLQQLRDELDKLELQTVMNGQVPMALISGQVVREQAKLGSFTVSAIEPMAVILTADDNSYRLSMKNPGGKKER